MGDKKQEYLNLVKRTLEVYNRVRVSEGQDKVPRLSRQVQALIMVLVYDNGETLGS